MLGVPNVKECTLGIPFSSKSENADMLFQISQDALLTISSLNHHEPDNLLFIGLPLRILLGICCS